MIRRHELSDAEWEFVRPLLPVSLRGRKRLDDRRVLNGIVWKFRTGVAWRDVPGRYGPWATLHTRFRRWAADGASIDRRTSVLPKRFLGSGAFLAQRRPQSLEHRKPLFSVSFLAPVVPQIVVLDK
ncbi:transposase [Kitasatospora albolonga]|uniref:transposase n=1 Tax=Kitasatospora albolonga TaxID=68173 RepID=UPI0039BC5B34